jgi:hypothetical protein
MAMHPGEIAIPDEVVRALVDAQFPQWRELPVRRLGTAGTVNAYVDYDSIVLAHARALLKTSAAVTVIEGDLRKPAEILAHPGLNRLIHFPGPPVIGRHAPATHSAGHRAGEGLPGSRRHSPNVPHPIRRAVPRDCASRLYTASMAFTPISKGSALPCPPQRTAE